MTVHIVGAGPGDPELLTVRAARLLAAADVVVHDAQHPLLLALAPPDVECIDVLGASVVPQEVVNALLVRLGRQGLDVVRLKGGDPYLFGRGGEEAVALAEAGVPFDVTPGVAAALAAPAAMGVPVVHRPLTTSVTVVSGHQRPPGEPDADWAALARLGGTLVVVMGVARRGEIAALLMAAGLDPSTPVAACAAATTPTEQSLRTTLAGLGAAAVPAPATIVIGTVAALDVTAGPTTPPSGTAGQA